MAFSVRMSREEDTFVSCKEWWNEKRFTDITLFCENEAVEAHKLILASQSGYFNRILGSIPQSANGPASLVALPVPSKKLLKEIVEYLYCGQVDISPEDMNDFIELGRFLEIPSFISLADNDLIEALQSETLSSTAATSSEDANVDCVPEDPLGNHAVVMGDEITSGREESAECVEDTEIKITPSDHSDWKILNVGNGSEENYNEDVSGGDGGNDDVDMEVEEGPAMKPPDLETSSLRQIGPSIWLGRRINSKPKPGERRFWKVYFCGDCGYVGKSRDKALLHERIHTGERPFPCDFCDSAFRQSAHLKKHYERFHGQRHSNVARGAHTTELAK